MWRYTSSCCCCCCYAGKDFQLELISHYEVLEMLEGITPKYLEKSPSSKQTVYPWRRQDRVFTPGHPDTRTPRVTQELITEGLNLFHLVIRERTRSWRKNNLSQCLYVFLPSRHFAGEWSAFICFMLCLLYFCQQDWWRGY